MRGKEVTPTTVAHVTTDDEAEVVEFLAHLARANRIIKTNSSKYTHQSQRTESSVSRQPLKRSQNSLFKDLSSKTCSSKTFSTLSTSKMPRLGAVNPQTRTRRSSRKRKLEEVDDPHDHQSKRRKIADSRCEESSTPGTATPSPTPTPTPTPDVNTDSKEESNAEEVFCVCRKPYDGKVDMFQCPNPDCGEWFHPKCLKMSKKEMREMDSATFNCPMCHHGQNQNADSDPKPTKPIPKKKRKESNDKKVNTTKSKKRRRNRRTKSTNNLSTSNIHINDGTTSDDAISNHNNNNANNSKPSELTDRRIQTDIEHPNSKIIDKLRSELKTKDILIKELKGNLAQYDAELKTMRRNQEDGNKYIELNKALNSQFRKIVADRTAKAETIRNQQVIIDNQRNTIHKLKEELQAIQDSQPVVCSRGVEANLPAPGRSVRSDERVISDSLRQSQQQPDQRDMEMNERNMPRNGEQIGNDVSGMPLTESSAEDWWQCGDCGTENDPADSICMVCNYQSQTC